MKIFANKSIWRKIVILLLFISIFGFVAPKPVAAGIGGELMNPVIALIVNAGDGIVNVIHKVIVNKDVSMLRVDRQLGLGDYAKIFLGVAVGALAIAATWYFFGGAAIVSIMKAIATTALKIGVPVVLATSIVGMNGIKVFANLVRYTLESFTDSEIEIPLFSIGPEEIFEGQIPMFNVNFFDSKLLNAGRNRRQALESGTTEEATAEESRGVLSIYISEWYYRLLMLAAIGMISVLVYIGIRILISARAADKAKYKQMLGDWFVGMVLLFTMHYIMTFSNFFVDKLTDVISSTRNRGLYEVELLIKPNEGWKTAFNLEDDKIKKDLKDAGYELKDINSASDSDGEKVLYTREVKEGGENDGEYLVTATNLMGKLRYETQRDKQASEKFIGYAVLYIMMVIYLVMFCFTYLRRVIYMAFLTLIAPLVALTYPIDKANDGKAQGFNFWFKEYIFNLLIQPLHLLLYLVLVSGALELAQNNVLYAIVVLGFMTQAEKLLRAMFNFQKAQTPGVFGGLAGGALVMSGMKWLTGRGPKGGPSGSSGKGGSEGSSESGSVNTNAGERTMKNFLGLDATPQTNANTNTETNAEANSRFFSDLSTEELDNQIDFYKDKKGAAAKDRLAGLEEERALREAEEKAKEQKDKNKVKPLRDYKGAARAYLSANAKKVFSKDAIKRYGKAGVRFTGKLAGGLAMGTVGLAAGATTGEFSKAAQYAGIGAMAGTKIGSNALDSIINGYNTDNESIEAAKRAYYGEEEYQKKQALKNQKLAMRDENRIKRIQEKMKLSREDAERRNKEMVSFYSDNKINDIDEQIKIEKTKDKYFKDDAKGREKATWGYQFYKQYGLDGKLDPDKRSKRMNKAIEDYKDVPGASPEMIKEAFKWADAYNRTVNNI